MDKNLDPKLKSEDKEIELSLRPKRLKEFIGQKKQKINWRYLLRQRKTR